MKINWNRVWAIMMRHIYTFRRDIENIFETFWWPTLDIVIWGLMSVFITGQSQSNANIVAYIVGGIYLWMLVYRAQQDISFTILKEIWDRNFMSIVTSPVTIPEYIVAAMLLGLVRLALATVWIYFLTIILYSFNILSVGFYLVPFAVNLLVVGWWTGLLINSLIFRYGYRVQSFAWSLLFLIQPFSAVFYPLTTIPGWMQNVAKLLPTSYIFEGMRQVISSGTTETPAILMATSMNITYLILSLIIFAHSYEAARKSGMIVKFS